MIPPPVRAFDVEGMARDTPLGKTFNGPRSNANVANTIGWRRADVGAGNGHGNARSLARVMSAVSLGGVVDGVRLLSPSTIDLIFQEQASGVDLILGVPLRWGIGFALPQPATVPSIPDEGRICFWGGWGGSMIVMHPDRGLTISYVMNKMSPGIISSDLADAYISAVYEGLA